MTLSNHPHSGHPHSGHPYSGHPQKRTSLPGSQEAQTSERSAAGSHLKQVRLGGSVVEANGYELNDLSVVVVQNFLPSLRSKGGLPLQIDPGPDDNKSTNHLAVPCLASNERALTTTLPPRLDEYYVEVGLIDSKDQVISVNGELGPRRFIGFPHFDPVSLAIKQRLELEPSYFTSAFTSDYIRGQARDLGLRPVQQSDSYLTNDKIGFAAHASAYGYSCCPHVALKTAEDIDTAAQLFQGKPVWIKYSHAFGGDLLMKVESPLSAQKLCTAVGRMYRSVSQAAQVNDYGGATIDTLWPFDSLLPRCGGISVELDARYIDGFQTPGRVLCTGSNLMEIRSDGASRVRGYFEQIIGPTGDFWGSCAFDPLEKFGPFMKEELDRQFMAIARYAAEQLNLFGLVGVDFMVVERPDGEIRPVMIELNGRPPISACSHIVGSEKLQAPFWVSRYMWAPSNLESAADFEQVVTVNGKNRARTDVNDGVVVPMYLASVSHRDPTGKSSVVISKNWAQVLVAGEDKKHCEEIFSELQRDQGVSFTRPNSGAW